MIEEPENDFERPPSKSARKREMDELQVLGVSLREFDQSVLETLPLSVAMLRAVSALRAMKERGAIRRQRQFIGKLMRNEDVDALREAIAKRQQDHDRLTRISHLIEGWRERVLDEGTPALEALIQQLPAIDRQQLRQLITTAQRERELGRPPAASRKLFKLIRDAYMAAEAE